MLKWTRAKAATDAVYLLRKLTGQEAGEKLEAATKHLHSQDEYLSVTHKAVLLSNFYPDVWVSCFIDLSPRGDCQEKYRRLRWLKDKVWAKTLIERGDFKCWRISLEFVASAYNVLLRRSQLTAVRLFVAAHAESVVSELADICHQDIVAQMMASGECDSVRELLRKRGSVDLKLQHMFQQMQ